MNNDGQFDNEKQMQGNPIHDGRTAIKIQNFKAAALNKTRLIEAG
jgi:hypothetical protein